MMPLRGRPATTTSEILRLLHVIRWTPFEELRAEIDCTYQALTSALYRLVLRGAVERRLEFPGKKGLGPGRFGDGPGGSVAWYRLR